MPSVPLTRQLAAFVVDPAFGDIPAPARTIIRNGFADTIATMIAGTDEPVTRIVRDHVRNQRGGVAEASVLLGDERASAADAALINGTAAHALDYDDVALAGHPSTVLVPAVLAEAEAVGASGEDALRAYLIGYEVWGELIGRERDTHHTKGWHPTGVFGTIGAAAAAAHLRRLDREQAASALAIAASFAAGLTANFGTMTKPLHAGRAASNGIEAVRLAQAGITAAGDAFEHDGGFLAAFSPAGNVDRDRDAGSLGKRLSILESGLSIKKYPMCYATHRVIDGILDLARQHGVAAAAVDRVDTTIGRAQIGMLRNHDPVTGLEAKFSLEFAVASALVAGKVGLGQLNDAFVNEPPIKELMRKVRIAQTDTRCPIEPFFALSDRVVLRMKDGRTLDSGEVRFARGNAQLPLREDELRAKFMDCLSSAREIDAPALFDRLMGFDSLPRVDGLAGRPAELSARSAHS